MGKDIDWDAIREAGIDLSSPEALARTDACLKKALGVSGPRVTVRDVPTGTTEVAFTMDVDFDTIEFRGRDSGSAPKAEDTEGG